MDAMELKIAKRIRDGLELPTGATTRVILNRLVARGWVTITPETTPRIRLTSAGLSFLTMAGGISKPVQADFS